MKNKEMKQIIFISLIILSVIFVILVIFQIIWIRSKLKNFDQTNLASKMTKEVQLLSKNKNSNVNIYSLILKCDVIAQINSIHTKEYDFLIDFAKPKKFNIPHVCGNKLISGSLSCMDVCFLCVDPSESASYLLEDIKKGAIMYIFILGKYYLIAYDEPLIRQFHEEFINYNNEYIFFIYPIKSTKNYLTNVSEDCSLEISPFMGELSEKNLFKELNLNKKTMQMHILGYVKI